MNELKKKAYEAPLTKRALIEMEETFCSSANITNPNEDVGKIEKHEVNTDFSADFSSGNWDE